MIRFALCTVCGYAVKPPVCTKCGEPFDACHEDMGSDPCGKPPVATREDPNHGGFYPVCAEHDRP